MMNSLVSSLTTFTDNISDNITSLISNTENPIIRIFKTENHNNLQKEDDHTNAVDHEGIKPNDPGGRTVENTIVDELDGHQVDPKKINSEETMRKGYSEDVPDANPDYQPAYDTQEQPWPWSMNQRLEYRIFFWKSVGGVICGRSQIIFYLA